MNRKSINIYTIKKATKYTHDIRWYMKYDNGYKRAGLWTSSALIPVNRASIQPKLGLYEIGIELQDKRTQNIFIPCKCFFNDWDRIEFIVSTGISAKDLSDLSSRFQDIKITPSLEGMSLITKHGLVIKVYIDGTIDVTTR